MRRRDALLFPTLALPAAAAWAQEGTVLIGAEDDWFPYSAERQGRAQGLTVDLVAAAFAAVGVQARFQPMPYARCMAQTRTGSLAACFNTTRTLQIKHAYRWPARPMFEERFLIYARAEAAMKRPGGLQVRDLDGERVAVTRGYEYGSEFDANPRIRRVVTSHDETNFRLLLRDRADYTLAPGLNAQRLFERHQDLAGRFKVVGQLNAFGIYTAFSRHHPDAARMLAAFDEGMRLVNADGTAKALQERWRRPAEAR
ncbi:MAG: transporter substrate-binding domain-containing protein [Roseateles sp.]|uniref:substrate-binding periplasmic protein n=1 Tax=Roseateles sp. TaxID=1971397 RepID=UPI0039ECA57E